MTRIFFNQADVPTVKLQKRKAKAVINQLFKLENIPMDELSYVFCSDEYLLDMNREHLGHDYYTDIITFDLSSGTGSMGDIYISIDRVKENATLHTASVEMELMRVMIHGVLHLCGYKDRTKPQKAKIRAKEDEYLRIYNARP